MCQHKTFPTNLFLSLSLKVKLIIYHSEKALPEPLSSLTYTGISPNKTLSQNLHLRESGLLQVRRDNWVTFLPLLFQSNCFSITGVNPQKFARHFVPCGKRKKIFTMLLLQSVSIIKLLSSLPPYYRALTQFKA